jgi:hypothetical protein
MVANRVGIYAYLTRLLNLSTHNGMDPYSFNFEYPNADQSLRATTLIQFREANTY